jgi:ABC-2 type transport system ATP-binding protein
VNEILVNEDIVEIGSDDNEKLLLILKSLNTYSNLKERDNLLQLFYPAGTANLAEINKHCFNNGIVLNHLHLKKKSLEDKFFELTNN